MKEQFLNELAWELDDLVSKRMEENPYGDEDLVREMVAREFAEWLVEKFKEERE